MSVITLTSDIGTRDYLIGAVKGRLLTRNEQFRIVDISHEVTPFHYNEAAYFIQSAYRHFPEFSWHILLVNLFYQPVPRCLLAFHDGRYFACPDNGLLTMIFQDLPAQVVVMPELTPPVSLFTWMDAIADAMLALESGKSFAALGEEPDQLVTRYQLKSNIRPDFIEGRIIYIDRFENVVVNITRQQFEAARKGRPFSIVFKSDQITRLSEHYGQVAEGDKMAFFNGAGYLEIAVNKGNASGLFGLQAIDPEVNNKIMAARHFYQVVAIYFEEPSG